MNHSRQLSSNANRHHHRGQHPAPGHKHGDRDTDDQREAARASPGQHRRHTPSPLAQTAPPSTGDRLEFFSKSPDVLPGEGRGELVKNQQEYADLAKIKSWRAILSNFHMADFDWVGYTWPSIEHAYQGAKMLMHSRAAFVAFSKQGKAVASGPNAILVEQAVFGEEGADKIEDMKANAAMMQRRTGSHSAGRGTAGRRGGGNVELTRSGHSGQDDVWEAEEYPHIGADTSLAARLARNLVPLTIEQVEYWYSVSRAVMFSISRAKYAQSPLAQRTLLATNKAELWHRVRANDPLDRFDHLERLRAELRQESQDDGDKREVAK